MKSTTTLITLLAFATSLSAASQLPRSSPESQGIPSSAILSFIQAANKNIDSLHSFMLLRHGHVVAEAWWYPYSPQSPHALYSLSKSFTSTAVGLAIAEGKLNLHDPVAKFFPDDLPPSPNNNLKAMRVSDLLRMSTGHQTEPPRTPDQPWTKTFLEHPVPFKPGTHFLYNTSASFMLSAIVQKTTGMTLLEYLQPRLFQPLGIQNPTWETNPQGISVGGYGLSIRTEDIASFGQLYLQNGAWNGKQLLPKSYVHAATSLQTSNGSNPNSDWDQGYGYQFWQCRNNAYRADGAFGQYCIVLPQHDAVIAITAGLPDMQAVLNLIWDNLLPAFKTAPLPPDTHASDQLANTLLSLSLRPQQGSASPALPPNKTFLFPDNDRKLQSLSLAHIRDDANPTLIIHANNNQYRITCGRGKWLVGRFAWGNLPEQPAAASAAWTDDHTFKAKICFYETPFTFTFTLNFTNNELLFSSEANVAFGPTREPQFVAKPQ